MFYNIRKVDELKSNTYQFKAVRPAENFEFIYQNAVLIFCLWLAQKQFVVCTKTFYKLYNSGNSQKYWCRTDY